jgi:hypothetical protein
MDKYALAMINMVACGAIGIVCICRLNAMQGSIMHRVKSRYAAFIAAAFASAWQPLIGEWPGLACIGMAVAVLFALLSDSYEWSNGPPQSVRGELS